MELGPEDVSLLERVSSFQRVVLDSVVILIQNPLLGVQFSARLGTTAEQ